MPYIKYTCNSTWMTSTCNQDWKGNWFGGSEPLVMQMLAKKYRFHPKYMKARAYDVTEFANGTGMVHMVRFIGMKWKDNLCNKNNWLNTRVTDASLSQSLDSLLTLID